MSEEGISAREAAAKVSCRLLVAFKVRRPKHLNMPPNYFPNAIYPLLGIPSYELLSECPVWKVAKFIHNLTREADTDGIEQTNRWIAVQDDRDRVVFNFCPKPK